MADPYDVMAQQAQLYGQQQAQTSPYAAWSAGLQSVNPQFTNPWVNLGLSVGANVGNAYMQRGMIDTQRQATTDAYNQLAQYSMTGQQPTAPGLQSYIPAINNAWQQAMFSQQNKVNNQALAMQRAVTTNLITEAAKWEANPQNQAAKSVGARNPYTDMLARGGGDTNIAFGNGGTTQPQQYGTLPPQQVEQASTGEVQAPATVVLAEPATKRQDRPISYMEALKETGNPYLAEQVKKESESQFQRDEKRREDAIKPLQELRKNEADANSLLNELSSAYIKSGETGSILPFEQSAREAQLKFRSALGDTGATSRLEGMKSLESAGLQMVGEIRKMFPGQVSNAEMNLYLRSAPGVGNVQAQNKAMIEKIGRLKAAGTAALNFIQQRVDEGMTYDQAEAAYRDYDRKNPLFVVNQATGEMEVNYKRLPGAGVEDYSGLAKMEQQAATPQAKTPFIVTAPNGAQVEIVD